MTRENISIANFLSTFGMASESCLNNLHLSRDQRERLFEQFRTTTDRPTREQIMSQLFAMTQQESAQLQFMLDIIRSMSKAYADYTCPTFSLHSQIWCFSDIMPIYVMLTQTSTLSGFAIYAPPQSQVVTRLRGLSLMQEYEHLIGLGGKPGSKKEQRFHPYKKNKKGRGGRQQAQ